MPHDIFISYSSQDREHAVSLVEHLRELGYSVWIDHSGIGGGEAWTAEITSAINDCTTLLLLLSSSSIGSHNVTKELLMATEKHKHILPVVLEEVILPLAFEYPLAGLQRVSFSEKAMIVKAIERLRSKKDIISDFKPVGHSAITRDPAIRRVAVLSFEDLSPLHDNEWFSDGLTDELILMLSRLPLLSVPDRQTTKYYKNSKLKAQEIAGELGVRFIVEGTVRKHDDIIKISAMLVDSHTGKCIWSDTFRSTVDNIFDIQERVAKEIAEALKVELTFIDESKLSDRLTTNVKAYELYLRSRAAYGKYSKESIMLSAQLSEEAIALDPSFSAAYALLSYAYISNFRLYDRNLQWIELGFHAAERASELAPEHSIPHIALSYAYLWKGEHDRAISEAKKAVELDPTIRSSHYQLGFVYMELRRYAEAIPPLEQALTIDPTSLAAYQNLFSAYQGSNDEEGSKNIAERAKPHFERTVRLDPENISAQNSLATVFFNLGKKDKAIAILKNLSQGTNDPLLLYNIGNTLNMTGDSTLGLETVKRAFELGFQRFDLWGGAGQKERFADNPEMLALIDEIDKVIEEKKNFREKIKAV